MLGNKVMCMGELVSPSILNVPKVSIYNKKCLDKIRKTRLSQLIKTIHGGLNEAIIE